MLLAFLDFDCESVLGISSSGDKSGEGSRELLRLVVIRAVRRVGLAGIEPRRGRNPGLTCAFVETLLTLLPGEVYTDDGLVFSLEFPSGRLPLRSDKCLDSLQGLPSGTLPLLV